MTANFSRPGSVTRENPEELSPRPQEKEEIQGRRCIWNMADMQGHREETGRSRRAEEGDTQVSWLSVRDGGRWSGEGVVRL